MKMNKMVFLTLSLSTAMASAADVASYNLKCTPTMLQSEPHQQVQFLTAQQAADFGAQAALFSAPVLNDKMNSAKVAFHDVSSAHIVNQLASALRQGYKDFGGGKPAGPQLLEDGVSYSQGEYRERLAQTADFRSKVLAPNLETLYRVYFSKVRSNEDWKRQVRQAVTSQHGEEIEQHRLELRNVVREQVRFLNAFIAKYAPKIQEKLGVIEDSTSVDDLPLSFRDGYAVKIRFRKGGEKRHITVYPRLLLNALNGQDQDFLTAMNRWSDYTQSRFEANNAGITVGRLIFSVFNDSENQLADNAMMQYVAIEARRDAETAKWVSEQMASLTNSEIYFLLGIFSKTIEGNIPRCGEVVAEINANMRETLKGKTTMSLPEAQKRSIDRKAEDIVFLQDMYEVFSTAAAQKIATIRLGHP